VKRTGKSVNVDELLPARSFRMKKETPVETEGSGPGRTLKQKGRKPGESFYRSGETGGGSLVYLGQKGSRPED